MTLDHDGPCGDRHKLNALPAEEDDIKALRYALLNLVAGNVSKVRAINARYAQPRLAMSPAVRWSLLALRFYLLTLVGLLGYKFVTVVIH